MADFYLGQRPEAGPVDGEPDVRGSFSVLFNWVGAIMSVVLVVGLATWGYRLAVRDVTGVPVVRALAGPMRVAPDDPGGELAEHQGLAVNSVAEDGGADGPADRLILAPAPLDLAAEDLPRARLAEVDPEPGEESEVTDGEVLALADGLAEGATPLSATIPPPGATGPAASGVRIIPASVRGVSISPFPRPRPAGDLTAAAVADAVVAAITPEAVDVDPDSLPVGTRLVQFGAFDSPEEAVAAWGRLDARFTDFLAEKKRVIQRAVSGGKTFYRLRAVGFEDINDARRFCSALLAERQACIPVVTR